MILATPDQGGALIEFTLLITLLVLFALGVIDFGLVIQEGMVVSAAAQAAAEYAAVDGNYSNSAGITLAAQNAAKGITLTAVTLSTCCSCSAGGSCINCASLCSTYDIPRWYVQVQTTATIPVLFRYANLPVSVAVGGKASLRVR